MATIAQAPGSGGQPKEMVQRALIGVAVVLVLALLAWGVSRIKLGTGGPPKRQTVKIMLPDTPPPPPPKQEEKKPEPKEENKPTPQMEQKPIEAPPQPAQALKMEGAAGDGPSAFSAGSVSKDYKDGQAVTGAPGGTGSDRAKYQFYVNSVKQLLRDEIERHLQTDQKQLVVSFSIWVKPDGSVDRYEVSPTGNERADEDIKSAFAQTAKSTKLPPPRDTPQPLRLRMTLLPVAS